MKDLLFCDVIITGRRSFFIGSKSIFVEMCRVKCISKYIFVCYIRSKERITILAKKKGEKMKTKDVFREVAKKYNITSKDVYEEIQKAIDAGFSSSDPKVREEWRKMNIKGDNPTPEEVIAYLVGKLQNERKS